MYCTARPTSWLTWPPSASESGSSLLNGGSQKRGGARLRMLIASGAERRGLHPLEGGCASLCFYPRRACARVTGSRGLHNQKSDPESARNRVLVEYGIGHAEHDFFQASSCVPALAASASVDVFMCGISKKTSVQELWREKVNMQMS